MFAVILWNYRTVSPRKASKFQACRTYASAHNWRLNSACCALRWAFVTLEETFFSGGVVSVVEWSCKEKSQSPYVHKNNPVQWSWTNICFFFPVVVPGLRDRGGICAHGASPSSENGRMLLE